MQKSALIVVDMLNPYAHEDADLLARSVQARLKQIVAVIAQAKGRDDVQLIYVNDNCDAWDAGRDALVERALAGERPDLVELNHVLRIGDVDRVVLVGQVTEQCILYSALDAFLRGYEVVVAPDGVAHIDDDLAEAALRMMERNMHVDLAPVDSVF